MDRHTRRFLHYAGHRVSLLRLPTHREPVLGTARPDETGPRLRTLEDAGIDARSPRAEDPATIDQALPSRARTALSYEAARGRCAWPTDPADDADAARRRRRHVAAHADSDAAADALRLRVVGPIDTNRGRS